MKMTTPNKILKMEDILKKDTEQSNNKQTQKIAKERVSPEKVKLNVPRGKPKSGRVWKSERTKFSSIIKTRGIRRSFEKKEALRKQLKHVKEASNAIKATKQQEKEQKKQRRRENLKRQEENRKKSEVVQIISNTKKLKKMKKKQLRSIEKRDTAIVSN